jgi:predicted permease
MQVLWQDLRYGIRKLVQHPGFTTLVVLVLGLGIGANTAIFSVVNAVLLSPLAYNDPHQLVVIKETNPAKTIEPNNVSPGNFLDLRQQESIFDSVTAFYETASTIQGDQGAEQVASAQVSVEFFKVLRVQPALGRVFMPNEGDGVAFELGRFVSGDRKVVISDQLWRQRFGSDPAIIGRQVTINRTDWEIVGVMKSDFSLPSKETDVWFPWDIARTYNSTRFPQGPPRDWRFLRSIARLRDGVPPSAAATQLSSLYNGLAEREPATNRGWSAVAIPLHEEVVSGSRQVLWIMFGAVAMVLVLASANVAGLVLTRAIGRQREIALRLALGASRVRVVRQLFTESFLLALAGGVVGVVLATLGLQALLSMAPLSLPRLDEVAIDKRVLLFALLTSILSAVVVGLLPALKVLGSELSLSLKDGGGKIVSGRITKERFRNGLVIAEVSIALVLITCAALFIRSFVHVISINQGFDSSNLLTMHITLDGATYDRRSAEYYRQLIERIQTLPSVISAAAVTALPMSDVGVDFQRPYWRAGEPEPNGDGDKVTVRMATPGYFKTMGIPLLQGRNFSDDDRLDTVAVMIVNKDFAEKVWGNENPIGRRLMLDYNRGKYVYEVVGVSAGVRHYGPKVTPRPEVFIPHAQNAYLPMNVVVRTTVDPNLLKEAIKAEVRTLDPTQPVSNIQTMDALFSRSTAVDRFAMWLLGLLGVLALTLASSGVFGLFSYFVSQRTHELGVRIALGAQRRDILKLVLGRCVWLLICGISIGLGASYLSTRFFGSLLYGVSSTDPLTFIITPALLASVAVVACYIPAHRATVVDPLSVLRSE